MLQSRLYLFSLAPTGKGLSGSDRIFIELAREWSKKIQVNIFTTQEGLDMMNHQNLSGEHLNVVRIENGKLPAHFFLKYLYKILLSIKLGLSLNFPTDKLQPIIYLYSSSDFWMDVFPAVLIKMRFNKIKWIATWYQTAPNPLKGFKEGDRTNSYKISALLYWISQLFVKPIITKFADKVIVNNIEEKKQFKKHSSNNDTIVLLGAVPLTKINKYISEHGKTNRKNEFDAVFQGRFHPQKGVVELVEIWKKVVEKIPSAKLAMIGDGPLMKDVVNKISDLGLIENIKLFGYLFDGPKKYEIFSKSKIVVHPAFYDSGGMASAEAMAFGIPAVGFNLKAYESYYPTGMIKVKTGNLDEFAEKIITLLENDDERIRIGNIAKNVVEANWSWEVRSKEILSLIKNDKK